MKRTYFIKHDQRVRRVLGCDRATLIFDRLEFYSKKQPDGFYKFLEPNSHKLYKTGESWAELLRCHRTSFWRSFKLIGKKHTSQWEFEKAKDKFEGKLYASYYDRLNNRMFFIRNDEAVDEFFIKIQSGIKPIIALEQNKQNSQPCPGNVSNQYSVPTEHNAHSYKDAKKTSSELFNNNSHASNEIVKQMIELWIAIVEEGRGEIDLRSKRIAFLKKAFKDKFDSCLEKWKKYCIDIARSKYLMGEKTSWKADLDWALKFDSIQKIFDGNYGIGDRIRKLTPEELLERAKEENDKQVARLFEQQMAIQGAEQEIRNLPNESEPAKEFRIKWLNRFGEKCYREDLAECSIEVAEEKKTITILPFCDLKARNLVSWCKTKFEAILSEGCMKRIQVYHTYQFNGQFLTIDRWFGKEQEGGGDPKLEISHTTGASNMALKVTNEEPITPETTQLRDKLRAVIPPKQYPGWLADIEVERIDLEGRLIINFKEQVIANYCQLRFGPEILKIAQEVWPGVKNLIVQEKSVESLEISEAELDEIDEKQLLQQAIQSLIDPSSAGMGQGSRLINDEILY